MAVLKRESRCIPPLCLYSFSTRFSFVLHLGKDKDSALVWVIIVAEHQNLSLWTHHSLTLCYSEDDRQSESYFCKDIHVWIFQIYNYFLSQKWLLKFYISLFLLIPVGTSQTETNEAPFSDARTGQKQASGDFEWNLFDVRISSSVTTEIFSPEHVFQRAREQSNPGYLKCCALIALMTVSFFIWPFF